MPNEQLEFIKTSIQERLDSIERRRLKYRKQAYLTYILTACLSGLTTILLGLKIELLSEYVRIAALILTTFITIINAYNAFFNNKELWIANNHARNQFNELNFKIKFDEKSGEPLTAEKRQEYKETYQQILNELNADWQRNRMVTKKDGYKS